MVVKDCIERGLTYFDLGRGEERYKSSWCDTKIQMIETNLALTRYASGFFCVRTGQDQYQTGCSQRCDPMEHRQMDALSALRAHVILDQIEKG